jgi:small conductance mechanosensitive channel
MSTYQDLLTPKTQEVNTSASDINNPSGKKSIFASNTAQDFYIHDLKVLLKSLEDPVEYAKLLSKVRALVNIQNSKDKEDEEINYLQDTWDFFIREISLTVKNMFYAVELTSEFASVEKWINIEAQKDPWNSWFKPFLYILTSTLLGFGMGWFAKILLKKPQIFVSSMNIRNPLIFFVERIFQIILWIIPYLFFTITTYGISSSLGINRKISFLLLDLLMGGFIIKIIQMSLKALISPKYHHKRVLSLSDNFAQKLYKWLLKVTSWGLWTYFIILSMQELGLPLQVSKLFNQILGLIITIQIISFILQNRILFKNFLVRVFIPNETHATKAHHKFFETVSQIWHIPVIVTVCSFYLVVFFNIGEFRYLMTHTGIALTIFFVARLFVNFLQKYEKEHIYSLFSKHFPKLHSRLHERIHILEDILVISIYLFATYIQFRVWRIDLMDFFIDEQGDLFPLIKSLLRTLFAVFIAYAIWIAIDIFIEQYLEKEDRKSRKNRKSMSARIRTLIPIIRKIMILVSGSIVTFVFLGSLGIDTAPLLGGLAVISLAISFGAQSLVNDILRGFFIILEDSVAVDDIVEIDGKRGLVEAVTIRSLRLRDDFGHVHTIPFGEVKILTNMTREYARAVINLSVSYEEDTDYVIQVMKETGDELMNDQTYGHLILEEIEIKGIDKFEESAVLLQCSIKTKAGEQFSVRREFNRKIKKKFDTLGINMFYSQGTIYVPKDITPDKDHK